MCSYGFCCGIWRVYPVFCLDRQDATGVPSLSSAKPTPEEFAAIRENALTGDAEAQLYMGVFHANGDVAEQDYTEAVKWYLLSAEQGNATAMRNLGLLYDCGVGVERDFHASVRWYREAAKKAEPGAFMGLARYPLTYMDSVLSMEYGSYNLLRLIAFYLVQATSDTDGAEADFWCRYRSSMKFHQEDGRLIEMVRILAESGDSEAQLRMAVFGFQGQGGKVSKDDFNYWLGRSAERNPRAMFMAYNPLPTLYPMYLERGDQYKQEEAFRFAAISGLERYFQYRFDRYRDYRNRIPAMYSLAEEGFSPAVNHFLVGYLIQGFQDLTPEDTYRLAKANAMRGHWLATILMVHFHLHGIGCQQDYDQALSWLRKVYADPKRFTFANLAEILSGKNALGNDSFYAETVPTITDEALAYLLERGVAGDASVQVLLGMYYQHLHEWEEAKKWLRKAVEEKSAPGMVALSSVLGLEISAMYLKTYTPFDPNNPDSYVDIQAEVRKNNPENRDDLISEAAKSGYKPALLELFSKSVMSIHGERKAKRVLREIVADDDFGLFLDGIGMGLEKRLDEPKRLGLSWEELRSPTPDYENSR